MNGSPLTTILPVAGLALPVALLLACLLRGIRRRMLPLLALAPVPALAAALGAAGAPPLKVFNHSPYRLTLSLDTQGAMLLGGAALLWIAAGTFAAAWLSGKPNCGRFVVCWLLVLTGSLGIFMAADLPGFFLFYALVSLPAYGLIVHDGTPSSRRAGAIYIGFALLGEALLLMAFVLLAMDASSDSLLIRDVMAALPASPRQSITLALIAAAFGLKIGLVPAHFWMPVAYTAAPVPAAAVLSGAAVKAGVIGFMRFLPFDLALPGLGGLLTALGLFCAFYGVAVGITQPNPKAVLAYSSVSQMGFIAAILGLGLTDGDLGVSKETAFYATHHLLVKGSLFLALGVASVTGSQRIVTVLAPASVLALGLGGLPLTGGALAKLAVKGPVGNGVVNLLATLSATATTLLMLHFLYRLKSSASPEPARAAPAMLAVPWLAMAAASIAVPWFLYPAVGNLSDALTPSELWKVLWPVLLGCLLALGLRRGVPRLPPIPEGDILALTGTVARGAAACGAALERADLFLRQWPVASVSLFLIAILLAATMLVGR